LVAVHVVVVLLLVVKVVLLVVLVVRLLVLLLLLLQGSCPHRVQPRQLLLDLPCAHIPQRQAAVLQAGCQGPRICAAKLSGTLSGAITGEGHELGARLLVVQHQLAAHTATGGMQQAQSRAHPACQYITHAQPLA
jgi:hypothetical protein